MIRLSRRAPLLCMLSVCASTLVIICMGLALPQPAVAVCTQRAATDKPVVTVADVVSTADEPAPLCPYSEEEMDLLARVISAEARGESYEGQVAVGAVILNRVASAGFPGTIEEVCHQPGAFSGVADGQVDIPPSESCIRAAQAAVAGEDPTGGALYFYNPKTAESGWIRSRPVVVEIGNHRFCT